MIVVLIGLMVNITHFIIKHEDIENTIHQGLSHVYDIIFKYTFESECSEN